jgi:hypothetical protein
MLFGNSSPPHSDVLAWGVGHLLVAARKCWGDWIIGGGCRRWGVVTARRFISSKINAPRSTASSRRGDATANKGE